MKYRPEIDGLRAVAVLPVILFHAGFAPFSGGYVGVDVFFVISGYLITSILLKDLSTGTFTLTRFYERRARRILPALFLIFMVSTIAAWILLLPDEMKDFTGSLAAATTFWSNIYFWQGSGYFGGPAELKPLLHTWSLGVEEQYYILFPLFLMLAWGLGRKKIIIILASLFGLSLIGAHLGALNGSNGVFFLLPTRMWELLLGIFAAFYLARTDIKQLSKPVNEALGLAGLAMILAAVFLFDENTPTPGLPLLLPTLGALLIILCGQDKNTLIYKVLSFTPLVWIGLISYSAYLWHQPLLAFARHYTYEDTPPWLLGALCLATLPLSYLSWRFVEQPFRRKDGFSRRFIFTASAIGIVFFSALGAAGYFSNGFEKLWLSRHDNVTQKTYQLLKRDPRYDNFRANEHGYYDDAACRFNKPELSAATQERLIKCAAQHGPGLAVIGDSHAIDTYGVMASSSEAPFLIGLTKGGCQLHTSEGERCSYETFLSFIQDNPDVFSQVLFEQSGQHLLNHQKDVHAHVKGLNAGKESPALKEFTNPILSYLEKLAHHVPVLWFGPRISIQADKTEILARGCDFPYMPIPGLEETHKAVDIYLEETLKTANNISYLSQNKALGFTFPEDFMNCENMYWSDNTHLSAKGEARFGGRFDLAGYLKKLRHNP